MTKYPAQIDTSASLPSVVDNLTPVTGTVVNRLRDAIFAIEGELGVHPAYGFGTVRARLDNIESIIGSSGHGIALAGDLGNTVDLPYVIGLRGRPLSTVSPNINDVLLWDGISWVPQPYINNGPAGGDLSANYPNPLVAGWAGKALDIATMGSPSDGEVPVWHAGSNSWRAAPNTISSSGVSPGSAGQVFFTSSGLVSTWTTVSGDILSSSSSVGSLSVISLLGEVSLEKYGAIGNGVTDDHMAYTNAMASGNSVLIGSKTYLVSGYSGATTAAGQSIIGFGNSSVIKANTPAIVTVATDNVSISNVQLLGDIVTSINNHGIDVSSKVHTRISDVLITTPGGRGVSISTGDVGTPEQGPQITAVRVYGAANDYAFYLNGAEYVGIVNSMADGSLGGAYIDGGNNILIANQFTACGTSLYINSVTDTNDGHMIILGNNFNHSTGSESIHIEPLAKGLSIDHSHIYGFTANIYVKGDAGLGKKSLVRFKDNEIAVDSLNFDGALVEFDGNIFTADGVAGTNNTFNTSYNSHASTIIYRPNNMQLDGTPFDAGVDAQWDVPNDRSLNIKWAGTTIRSHWDGYHGQFYAGDGITDSVAIIGPLIGSETSFASVWLLSPGILPTSTNWAFSGGNAGADTYVNAGGTIHLQIAGNPKGSLTASLFDIVTAIRFDNLAGSGTGYIQLDAAGNLTRVATVPTSTIAPGTAGQVLITNATPSAVWTSLIDVELTHGRFTAGGTGSDFKAVIGPYVGGETSFAAVYLLPGATASNSTNESLLSSSADTYLNAPNGTGILYFGQGGSFQLSFDSTATLQWALGATPKINQATQTADIATHDFTISPQAPFATATLTNRTPGSLLVNIAAPTNSGTTYGQFKVQLAGSTVAHIDSQHGVGTFGGNGSDFFASAGPVPGSETTLSALWLLGSASSLSSTNYAVLGDGTDTIINAPGSGGVFLRIANTNYFEVTSTDTYLGGYSASALLYVANSAGSINWTTTASPLITQDTPGSDGATNSITIQAQAPFATATINKSPGNTIIKTPSPLASANFFGGFLWERGDNTPGMRVGYYGGPDTTYTGIWFNDAGAPNTSNFGFLGNQNFTYLNVPSGGSLALSVAGSSSSGKSHSFTGGNTWQETTGAAVAAYILNVSAGYMAIETQSSFYVDAATIYMRDVAHNTTIAWGIVSSGASQMQIQSAVTSFSFNQLTQTVDAAPANITIAPQAPFATATGTNRKPGSLIVNLAVPTNSGTNEGRFEVRRNGVSLGTIKQYDGVANTAELILGYGLADSQYTLYNDASSQSHLNSPGTTLYFEISGSQKSYMSASTYHFTSMAILEFDSALSTPKLYQATTTGSPTSLTIQSQATSQVSTNGGDLILTSGSGGSGGVPGQVLIANDKIGINTTIGYGSGVGAGSTVLAGNPIYIESYNGSNNVLFYASALSADWNGSLGEFVVVADLNNFTFHKSATTPKLWQETPVSDVSTSNLTIQAQSPFASATVHTIAGDVIVNTPASVSSGVKNGGFAVAYNGTNQVKIGAYNNGAYSAIWLGAGAVSPSLTNFTLLDNGTGYAALNASGGGNLYLAVGNVNYVTLTSVLFSVNNSSQIGLSTGTNTLIGALKETTRTVSASFTLDTTTTDRDVFVTATLTLTLDTAAHADGRKVTIWVDTTSTGSNGSDITLTIAPAGTEKINGTNANWAITVPGSPEQIQKLEMIGDGTNIRIA